MVLTPERFESTWKYGTLHEIVCHQWKMFEQWRRVCKEAQLTHRWDTSCPWRKWTCSTGRHQTTPTAASFGSSGRCSGCKCRHKKQHDDNENTYLLPLCCSSLESAVESHGYKPSRNFHTSCRIDPSTPYNGDVVNHSQASGKHEETLQAYADQHVASGRKDTKMDVWWVDLSEDELSNFTGRDYFAFCVEESRPLLSRHGWPPLHLRSLG